MKVVAIIPAYNEAVTIGPVLEIVKEDQLIDEIVVVNDGSTDGTGTIARSYGVEVVDLCCNIGKSGAVLQGMQHRQGDVLLLLDADLIGLRTEHTIALLEPVLQEKTEMTIGVFTSGRLSTNIAQKIAPCLSGQRALKREILAYIAQTGLQRFALETALTQYVKQQGIPFQKICLPYVTHLMKEEKMGFLQGVMARAKMYWDIIKYVRKE